LAVVGAASIRRAPANSGPTRADVVVLPLAPGLDSTVAPERAGRFASLDAFRGIAIAGMILVNNPGTWADVYAPLRHAVGNGCTAADLIFPFFLFIVGTAITFAVGQRARDGTTRRRLLLRVLRRAVLIFGLGIFLNGFPLFDWSEVRIPGVLQRVAVCYAITSLLVVRMSVRGQVVTAALLLVGYASAMRLVRIPTEVAAGGGADANLAAYIDHWLMGDRLVHSGADPEGVLSTLPAIATTLFGALAGYRLQRQRPWRCVAELAVVGAGGMLLGLLWARWLPMNKTLWTPSFTLFTGGVALEVLALCYGLIDCLGVRRWATPFVVYGTNPIVAYVLSSLMTKTLLLWQVVQSNGARITLQQDIFQQVFLRWARPINASLLYAMSYVLLWLAITSVLYRNRVMIKI
jgi:predicted acyltransferase